MSNPVFDRIDKDVRGGYAGFGDGRSSAPQRSSGRYGTAQDQMSAQNMQDMYDAPSASPAASGKLTVDDVVMKAIVLFGILLVTAGATMVLTTPTTAAPLMLGAVVVTLVLGIAIAMKKTISVPLIVAYAVVEGVLVGAVTQAFMFAYDGVVSTAVMATICVFIAMFVGWKTGVLKVTNKTRRVFGMAIMGYLLFAVVNLIAAWFFGANDGWGLFAFGSPISIGISILAVGLASYSLALDFDSIDRAVAAQVPQKTSWLLAHGLMVTVVWLYLELLRLIAQFSGRE